MQVTTDERRGERMLTIRIDEPELDGELVGTLQSVLNGESIGENTQVVFLFEGGTRTAAGDFPSRMSGPARDDMRYFARWEELIASISRLRAKTLVGYRGAVGAAAVQVGLVVDLRLAAAGARLRIGSLSRGQFPGTSLYWLPKFVGLGVAHRLLLLESELDAKEAARLGLLDVVAADLGATIQDVVERLRPITAEAACFARRILEESYRHERVGSLEQIKAARYKVDGSPGGSNLK